MNSKLLYLLFLTVSLPQTSFSLDGTRGGGQVVITPDQQTHLRDLVDPSVCDFTTGLDLRMDNQELNNIISKISKLDWYFASSLKYEIDHLDICMTMRLKYLPIWDRNSVIDFYPPNYPDYQAGIRILNTKEVFLDRYMYADLSPEEQAYLLIHEAIHNFIPINTSQRAEKVMFSVKTLKKVALGEIKSQIRMQNELAKADIAFLWTTYELGAFQNSIEFLLSPLDEQINLFLNSSSLDELFKIIHLNNKNLLFPEHVSVLFKDPSSTLGELLQSISEDQLAFMINKMLKPPYLSQNSVITDPLLVVFSIPDTLTKKLLSQIIKTEAFKQGPKVFQLMKNKKIFLQKNSNRIFANDGYKFLGIVDSEKANQSTLEALSVYPYTVENKSRISVEMQGFLNLVTSLMTHFKDTTLLQQILTQSELFYTSLNTEELQTKLREMQAPIPREKEYLKTALTEYIKGFRLLLLDHVTNTVSAEAADNLDREIDWNRLGLKK